MEITITLTKEQHKTLKKLLLSKVKELTCYNAACPQYAREEELKAMESLAKVVSRVR